MYLYQCVLLLLKQYLTTFLYCVLYWRHTTILLQLLLWPTFMIGYFWRFWIGFLFSQEQSFVYATHVHFKIRIVYGIQVFDLDIDVIKEVSFPPQTLYIIYVVGLFRCVSSSTNLHRTTICHKPSTQSAVGKWFYNRKWKFCKRYEVVFKTRLRENILDNNYVFTHVS